MRFQLAILCLLPTLAFANTRITRGITQSSGTIQALTANTIGVNTSILPTATNTATNGSPSKIWASMASTSLSLGNNTGASTGVLDVYPASAAKGLMRIGVDDQVGNTIANLRMGSQAATRTYTIPDAGGTADFMMSGTAIGAQLASRTIAQLRALAPTVVGQMFFCSDCGTDAVCVSSGTGTGAYVRTSARGTACQ